MKKKYLMPTTEAHLCDLHFYMHSVSVKGYQSGGKKTYGGDADETSNANKRGIWNQ